jgi:DNA-binding XRE family transcriptional regulator
LRAARILAGLTQKQLAHAVGVHERTARYWESKEDKAPTSTLSSLSKIEAALRDQGVIVFATPTRAPHSHREFCRHSMEGESGGRSPPALPMPHHRRAVRVFHLQPVPGPAGLIWLRQPLRHDALRIGLCPSDARHGRERGAPVASSKNRRRGIFIALLPLLAQVSYRNKSRRSSRRLWWLLTAPDIGCAPQLAGLNRRSRD